MAPHYGPASNRIEISTKAGGGKTAFPDDGATMFLRNAFASGHVNVLLGSAFSLGVVPTLGWHEQWFQAVEEELLADRKNVTWRAASDLLRAEYFRSVMLPLRTKGPTKPQKAFLSAVTQAIESRGTTTIPRRINVFTTNYDPLVELALEDLGICYNDGFTGRSEPVLDSSSFSRLQYVQSLFMEYESPVTTVNVIKPHGSLTWKRRGEAVLLSRITDTLDSVLYGCGDVIHLGEVDEVEGLVRDECDSDGLSELERISAWIADDDRATLAAFRSNYDSTLCLVNPAKSKFEETVLERCYYDLLRIYANELDRNNTLLLVSGFSFRDEHIRDLTLRAAKSNPRLLLLIACHRGDKAAEFEGYFGDCKNVFYLVPEDGKELGIAELAEVVRWIAR